jgi:hypothetical protein
MNRPVVISIAVGAFLSVAAPSNGQEFQAHVANPAFPQGSGPRVLWDAGHQNEHHWWMSAFHDVIRRDGFRLEFHGGLWESAMLASVDVVIIPGPAAVHRDSLLQKGTEHYWWSDEGRSNAFAPEEVAALLDWIDRGGALLLIVDHAPHPDASRLLTEALGVDGRNAMTWDGGRRPPGYPYPATDPLRASNILFTRENGGLGEHAILTGRDESERVDRVATYVGTSLKGPLGSTDLLQLSAQSFDYWRNPPERGGREHRVSAAGRAQAVAFTIGAGRVVVVGEFTPFQASWSESESGDRIGRGMAYAGAQDQQFATNIVRWLAGVLR